MLNKLWASLKDDIAGQGNTDQKFGATLPDLTPGINFTVGHH
jgi:hypothetical protein